MSKLFKVLFVAVAALSLTACAGGKAAEPAAAAPAAEGEQPAADAAAPAAEGEAAPAAEGEAAPK